MVKLMKIIIICNCELELVIWNGIFFIFVRLVSDVPELENFCDLKFFRHICCVTIVVMDYFTVIFSRLRWLIHQI